MYIYIYCQMASAFLMIIQDRSSPLFSWKSHFLGISSTQWKTCQSSRCKASTIPPPNKMDPSESAFTWWSGKIRECPINVPTSTHTLVNPVHRPHMRISEGRPDGISHGISQTNELYFQISVDFSQFFSWDLRLLIEFALPHHSTS